MFPKWELILWAHTAQLFKTQINEVYDKTNCKGNQLIKFKSLNPIKHDVVMRRLILE